MKLNLTLTMVLCGCMGALAQTIRIADNNPDRPAGANVFSTVQAAVNAAVPGDIVYVQPSLTIYSETVTIGKRITLQGVGFGVTELGGRSSTIQTVSLIHSSDGATSIGNAVISGLNIATLVFNNGGVGSFSFDNIVVDNCSITTASTSGISVSVNNLIIRNSFLGHLGMGSGQGVNDLKVYNNIIHLNSSSITLTNANSPLITNNLIYTNSPGQITISTSTNLRIEHNVFSGTGAMFYSVSNALITNNIFFGTNPGPTTTTATFLNNTFSNNIVVNAGFAMPPAANGGGANSGVNNQVGVNPMFTSAAAATAHSSTFDYKLLTGSPAIAAATTGDNIGPSGGLYPVVSNLALRATSMPVITLFGNSGVVPQNQPLKTNIKAKSN